MSFGASGLYLFAEEVFPPHPLHPRNRILAALTAHDPAVKKKLRTATATNYLDISAELSHKYSYLADLFLGLSQLEFCRLEPHIRVSGMFRLQGVRQEKRFDIT